MPKKTKVIKTTPAEQLILFAINNREVYGLEIQEMILKCSKGTNSVKSGTLYPVLHSLERKNLVESRWGDENKSEDPRRRYYCLKEEGFAVIKNVLDFQKSLLNP
ncbi:PadR family transcriptional regulator (plasmid) [Kovacikia minuta CCNUW1]|uniref:PadR family transcriptional regulator n=1 Tax=Kovacikia minuta TaxID=2931930 RepID=UPI001CD00EA7|nr:PadR family transcriptional regulator [Kovacikia minuta]UBF29886.1 PadR family transcriptional regulator [Kovacikia minuta CCNUW1]